MAPRVRYPDFLKEVFLLSVSCFGGPQAHLTHFLKRLVEQKQYLTEEELMELNALGQVLPGPTSTQTLTAVAYKLGGPNLAYLTLFIWMLPSVAIMTIAAVLLASFETKQISLSFARFVQPMAVGFVAYGAYSLGLKTITALRGIVIMVASAVISYFFRTPFVFPLILLVAGCVTAFNYRAHPRQPKKKFEVAWSNFFLWIGVLVFAALLGRFTRTNPELLPIRLFENFYRNGSLVFGGGQVLTPLLYTEFVQFAPKRYLTSEEFLSGYGLVQALPGPVYSFSSYIGALSMREFGTNGELFGALMSAAGIFLPGTFLIFFMIRIWDSLKSFRPIRASLEGILAANTGLVTAAALFLFQPLISADHSAKNILINLAFTLGTFGLVSFTKFPSWAIILVGLLLGLLL
ncbi:MAG: chromate efflux transporter [Bacteroidetes bacterium]|nr:chromate efflux transporter [Bacteroidota bacterium]